MKRRALLFERHVIFFGELDLIMYGNVDGIAPVGLDQGTWVLSIDQEHGAIDTIWTEHSARNSEVVESSDASIGWVLGIGVADCGVPPRNARDARVGRVA